MFGIRRKRRGRRPYGPFSEDVLVVLGQASELTLEDVETLESKYAGYECYPRVAVALARATGWLVRKGMQYEFESAYLDIGTAVTKAVRGECRLIDRLLGRSVEWTASAHTAVTAGRLVAFALMARAGLQHEDLEALAMPWCDVVAPKYEEGQEDAEAEAEAEAEEVDGEAYDVHDATTLVYPKQGPPIYDYEAIPGEHQ